MVEYLYIHIPFCKKRCYYCDFNSVNWNSHLSDRYIDALCKELTRKAVIIKELQTIYFGGGTPTILNKGSLKKILNVIADNCQLSKKLEITVEANPESLSQEKCEELLSAGVNRVSLGVQSLSDDELRLLGRTHTAREAIESLRLVRSLGFNNISVDLIYGIPKRWYPSSIKEQALKFWQDTIFQLASLEPKHFSIYELTIEKHKRLYKEMKIKNLIVPDEGFICEQYHVGRATLEMLGYIHYEISNFAKRGYECKHNLNYWNCGEYLGIGAGAHSLVTGYRFSNLMNVKKYIQAIEEERDTKAEIITLTPKDSLKEYIFLGLRKREGINILNIERNIFQRMLKDVMELIELKLLELENNSLKLTDKGLLLSNEVIVRLLKHT
ncbi:MAG: radical SAM family heme chaperone HemW [Thermodesulfovibrionales bacterium]|nr:radical SAM family heme chaperone HemW [Thermodesulfovibrionales bacterium]